MSYPDEPDAALLTDEEVHDYRVYLTGIKGFPLTGICDKAATVNAYLAPICIQTRDGCRRCQGQCAAAWTAGEADKSGTLFTVADRPQNFITLVTEGDGTSSPALPGDKPTPPSF